MVVDEFDAGDVAADVGDYDVYDQDVDGGVDDVYVGLMCPSKRAT